MTPSNGSEQDVWFRFFIEITPDATVVVDESGVIRMVNALAESLFQYTREEMVGSPVEMLVPEALRGFHVGLRSRFMQKASVRQMQTSIDLMAQRKSGEMIPVSIGLSPMETSSGGQYVLASVRDNTILHRAHAAVEEQAEEIRQITETANDAIITMDGQSVILSWNPSAALMFGHTAEEAVGQNLQMIIPPHLRQGHDEGIARVFSGGASRILGKTVEVEGMRKSGDVFPAELSLATWNSEKGPVFCGILRDITARKEAEDKLRRSEEVTKAVLKQVPASIALKGVDDVIILTNRLYDQWFPKPGQQAVGSRTADIYDAEVADELKAIDAEVKRTGQDITKEMEQIFPDGTTHFLQMTKFPVRDTDGSIIAVGSIDFDLTDRKRAEAQLKDAYDVITDSVQYAAKIQRSVLPDLTGLQIPDGAFFVLWEPRDQVGGDIYWIGPWGDGTLFLAGDCTGHGVPGAFITLIALAALEHSLVDVAAGDCGALIRGIHRYMQAMLGQTTEEGESDDGMELGVCYHAPGTQELTFAGARFDLFVADGTTVETVKGTKLGAGYRGIPGDAQYQNTVVQVQEGRCFYMTTDGLIDQIGGDRRRGFGKKRFKDVLATLGTASLDAQRAKLLAEFEAYKGAEAQRDDLCVIGFKLA